MGMMAVELDFLIALARSGDRHHEEVLRIIEAYRESLILSPYSLIELDLLVWSNNFRVREPPRFFSLLAETLKYYGIRIAGVSPVHFAEAYKLRIKYKLTFFDSLHAATSITEGLSLISYDRSYEKIEEVKYLNPSTICKYLI